MFRITELANVFLVLVTVVNSFSRQKEKVEPNPLWEIGEGLWREREAYIKGCIKLRRWGR